MARTGPNLAMKVLEERQAEKQAAMKRAVQDEGIGSEEPIDVSGSIAARLLENLASQGFVLMRKPRGKHGQ